MSRAHTYTHTQTRTHAYTHTQTDARSVSHTHTHTYKQQLYVVVFCRLLTSLLEELQAQLTSTDAAPRTATLTHAQMVAAHANPPQPYPHQPYRSKAGLTATAAAPDAKAPQHTAEPTVFIPASPDTVLPVRSQAPHLTSGITAHSGMSHSSGDNTLSTRSHHGPSRLGGHTTGAHPTKSGVSVSSSDEDATVNCHNKGGYSTLPCIGSIHRHMAHIQLCARFGRAPDVLGYFSLRPILAMRLCVCVCVYLCVCVCVCVYDRSGFERHSHHGHSIR